MKIAIIGASGFIGTAFVESFAGRSEKAVILGRDAVKLEDPHSLRSALSGTDVLVHLAFDHQYRDNVKWIKNILRACSECGVKKLIYLGSYVTQDFLKSPCVDGTTARSTLRDPYTTEKARVEEVLSAFRSGALQVTILAPTVVYGLGGSWSELAFDGAMAKGVFLPHEGKLPGPFIYVKDVVGGIWASIGASAGEGRFLLSGPSEKLTLWSDFFKGHAELLSSAGGVPSLHILKGRDELALHRRPLISRVFRVWFFTPLGRLLNFCLRIFFALKGKSSSRRGPVYASPQERLPSDRVLWPSGLAWLTMGAKSIVSCDQARVKLGFSPKFDFSEGLADMRSQMERA